MPRYFFHIQDGYSRHDTEGTELPDMYAVQEQAIRASGEILRDMGAKFWNGTEWTMQVADEQGQILLVLRFSAEERTSLRDPGPNSGRP